MSPYAENTSVPVERSRAEIEGMLSRYGADMFVSGWDREKSMSVIQFRAHERLIRFLLPMPDRETFRVQKRQRQFDKRRTDDQVEAVYRQEERRRWRALALVVKAKLEAVESGITTFEAEFLAHVVLPDGSTVGDWAAPQLANVYKSGQMPSPMAGLLPPPKDAK